MKFLKLMNDWHNAINKWMYVNPWLTVLYAILFSICLICIWHFVSQILMMVIFLTYVLLITVMLVADTAYLVKSGYQPPRCDKCGHILDDEERT